MEEQEQRKAARDEGQTIDFALVEVIGRRAMIKKLGKFMADYIRAGHGTDAIPASIREKILESGLAGRR